MAIVTVTAQLPYHGVRNGGQVDVTVSSMYNAKSLAGGTLLPTPLRSLSQTDDQVYAWASGSISIPDINNPAGGVVKKGADIEEDIIYEFVERDSLGRTFFDLVLDKEHATWQTAHTVAMFIDDMNAIPGGAQRDTLSIPM